MTQEMINSGVKHGYPIIPVIENIHQKVFEAASKPEALDMDSWHEDDKIIEGAHCGTTHCRAGWVVALAGSNGKILEDLVGTPHAALQIYHKSSAINVSPVRFYEGNEIAMADIKRCAEEESKLSN